MITALEILAIAFVGTFVVTMMAAVAWLVTRWHTPYHVDRKALIRDEEIAAEALIDQLTREALQRMRDVVRTEQRGGRRPPIWSITTIDDDTANG